MTVENQGNLVTCRSFVKRDGVKLHRVEMLAEITRKKGSTAYKMTEPLGHFGSGTPSPLHIVCELIRELDGVEQQDAPGYSSALEMATYPLRFYRALRGEKSADADADSKLRQLVKHASDASYLLSGRALKVLTLNDLRVFLEHVMSAATLAHELGMMTDCQITETDSRYKGQPIMRERAFSLAGEG